MYVTSGDEIGYSPTLRPVSDTGELSLTVKQRAESPSTAPVGEATQPQPDDGLAAPAPAHEAREAHTSNRLEGQGFRLHRGAWRR